jgi:hypothetical protein
MTEEHLLVTEVGHCKQSAFGMVPKEQRGVVRDPVKVRPYWFVPWGSLNAVRKYVSSPTTSTGLYLGRIGIYKVDYKLKNKEIRVRRRIIRVSDV